MSLGSYKNRTRNTNKAKEMLHDKRNDIAWANTRFWHRTLKIYRRDNQISYSLAEDLSTKPFYELQREEISQIKQRVN